MKLYKALDSYTIVSNEIFKHNLSMKAIGLYTYLVSKPDHWEFSTVGISTQVNDGKDAVRSALQELEDAGFLDRRKVKTNGKFDGYDYIVYGKPYPKKPLSENPTTGKPTTENPPQVNTEEVTTEKVNKNNKKEKSDYQDRYAHIIDWWNDKKQTRYKATDNNLGNFKYWADVYEDWEIMSAILIGYKHPWWHDKINPTRLFRRYSTNKDPIDYIGQLLNYRSSDPAVLRVKEAMKQMEEKSHGK